MERGFCTNFISGKSFNANAKLSGEELEHAQRVLTTYKYFTRNEHTDMSKPLNPRILHDKKFINIAEAFLKRKAVVVPKYAKKHQKSYQIS